MGIKKAIRSKLNEAKWTARIYLKVSGASHLAWRVAMPVHRAARRLRRLPLHYRSWERRRNLWKIQQERSKSGEIQYYFDC